VSHVALAFVRGTNYFVANAASEETINSTEHFPTVSLSAFDLSLRQAGNIVASAIETRAHYVAEPALVYAPLLFLYRIPLLDSMMDWIVSHPVNFRFRA